MTETEAANAVDRWREIYSSIVAGWQRCDKAIAAMYAGEVTKIDNLGLCVTGSGYIDTPLGRLRYPALDRGKAIPIRPDWTFGEGRHKSKLYGGLLCENLVQHLARQVLVTQMLQIQKRYPISHTVHDEVILVVRDEEAQEALGFMLDTMKTAPEWWPELVLHAEGDIGERYGQCK